MCQLQFHPQYRSTAFIEQAARCHSRQFTWVNNKHEDLHYDVQYRLPTQAMQPHLPRLRVPADWTQLHEPSRCTQGLACVFIGCDMALLSD
jgi:hypothetical protein